MSEEDSSIRFEMIRMQCLNAANITHSSCGCGHAVVLKVAAAYERFVRGELTTSDRQDINNA